RDGGVRRVPEFNRLQQHAFVVAPLHVGFDVDVGRPALSAGLKQRSVTTQELNRSGWSALSRWCFLLQSHLALAGGRARRQSACQEDGSRQRPSDITNSFDRNDSVVLTIELLVFPKLIYQPADLDVVQAFVARGSRPLPPIPTLSADSVRVSVGH